MALPHILDAADGKIWSHGFVIPCVRDWPPVRVTRRIRSAADLELRANALYLTCCSLDESRVNCKLLQATELSEDWSIRMALRLSQELRAAGSAGRRLPLKDCRECDFVLCSTPASSQQLYVLARRCLRLTCRHRAA